MTSKIKENLLFYLAGIREKSRLIAINHDLDLKSDQLIKLLIANCRFKFDLLLMENLRSNYLTSQFNFENVYSLFNETQFNLNESISFDEQITRLEQSIKTCYPDACLLIDSINLLILNYNAASLTKFLDYLLSKYCKVIFLFNNELIDLDYLLKIQELSSSYFELNRNSFSNDIQVSYVYKKKCAKLGLNLIKGDYSFTFDSNTHLTKLIDAKKVKKSQHHDDYTYDLAFNLTIEDKEREKTVLPFMRCVYLDQQIIN